MIVQRGFVYSQNTKLRFDSLRAPYRISEVNSGVIPSFWHVQEFPSLLNAL
jgi:hypothetical protein